MRPISYFCPLWNSWKHTVENKLAIEMVKSTRRPKSVQIIAKKFRENFLSKKYIAVHWRYEERDFGSHCTKKIQKGNEKPCQYILSNKGFNITKIQLGFQAITKRQNLTDSSIYFAAPPGAQVFVEKLKVQLENVGLHGVYQKKLRDFVKKEFEDCDEKLYKNEIHDFLSQVEQEICMTSWIFIPSTGSSWSNAIELERRVFELGKIDIPNSLFF